MGRFFKWLWEQVPDQCGRVAFWFAMVIGVPAAMVWMALQLSWFWITFRYFGVAAVVLATWALLSVALTGTRAWSRQATIEKRLRNTQDLVNNILVQVERSDQASARRNNESVANVVTELKRSVADLKDQSQQQFLASTTLTKLIDMRQSLRVSFDKLSKAGPQLETMIKLKQSETLISIIFDQFYIPIQQMQEECKKELGFTGDMLLGWGKSARTDQPAPNEETFPPAFLQRYRAAFQVYFGAQGTIEGLIQTTKKKISDVAKP